MRIGGIDIRDNEINDRLGSGIIVQGLSGGGNSISQEIQQNTHGFSEGDWVLYSSGEIWELASASTGPTSEVDGVVSEVVDTDNFVLTSSGWVELTGLTKGIQYLSNTSGEISTTPGAVSRPVGKAISSTKMLVRI